MATLFGLARLGRDAELKKTNSGESVASLSLAFSYGKKGADGKRSTQWIDGSYWGIAAERSAPVLLKGSLVAVTIDDVHIEEFTKKDGTAAAKLVGRVSRLDYADLFKRDELAPPPPPPRPPSPPPVRPPVAAPAASTGFDDMDDDVPF